MENHQEYNARALADKNAARIILNKELENIDLNKYIEEIILNKKLINEIESNANKISLDNVEEKIYREIKKTIITKMKNFKK